jgi:hypothetical protein
VHAILVNRAPPLVQPTLPAPPALSPTQVAEARGAALSLLTRVLGGDRLAAEYLLLAALGRVTARWVGQGVDE